MFRHRVAGLLALLVVVLLLLGATRTAIAESPTPLADLVLKLNHAGADSLATLPMSAGQAKAFETALRALAAGDLAAALPEAGAAGYDILEVSQGGKAYRVMIERGAVAVGPFVVLSAEPSRDVIVSAPHPVIDRATGIQSVLALLRLGARALIVAGAGRCAATETSPCSGKTSVCGSRSAYRISDAAHNPASLFHRAHEVLGGMWPDSVVLQLHGFSRKDSDAWAVLSDGSGSKRPEGDGLPEKVRDGIRKRLDAAGKAVSCQNPEDDKYRYRKLCARTNVQGRALNGGDDICHANAPRASGRFLHVEQSWDIRKAVKDHWREIDRHPVGTVVIDALGEVIPCSLGKCP